MSSRYKYTSVDRVFSKVVRDYTDDFNEDDVIEWCGEALEAIGSVKSYEEKVCFLTVQEHQAAIPKWCHAIIQLARHGGVSCYSDAVSYVKQVISIGDFDVDDTHVSNTISLKVNYSVWLHSGYYTSHYTPIRLTNHSFFNTLVCPESDNGSPYHNCQDEYNIINGNTLRFSFKEGVVAIAYLQQAVDENSYPLIPDTYSHTTAITKYIAMKLSEKDYFKNREGSKGKLDKFEADWQWYCKQAGNIDLMPYGLDEYQNLLDQRSYILPKQNNYFSFFGNLARPERRRWNNPDGRGIRGNINGTTFNN